MFRSVFGEAFLPSGFLGVTHGNGAEVYRGNILYPRQASEAPIVSLPSLHDHRQWGGACFFTVTLTNPDGNLQYNWKELLHWMVLVDRSIVFRLQLTNLSCHSLVSIFRNKAWWVMATPCTPMFLLCPLKGRGYTGWCSPCTLMPHPSPLSPFTQTRWDHGGYDHYCGVSVLWL